MAARSTSSDDIATRSAAPRAAKPTTTRAALAGMLAALSTLALTDLVAGVSGAGTSLLSSVAALLIRIMPDPLVQFGIETFGTNDKAALQVSIWLVAAVAGALVGILAVRWFWTGVTAFAAFAFLGMTAGASDPLSSTSFAVLTAAAAGAAGIALLAYLVGAAEASASSDAGRRSFLKLTAFTGVLGGAVLLVGRGLLARTRQNAASRAEVALPPAELAAPEVGEAASFDLEGLSPIVTPNDEFYRIDTALSVPIVDLETWRLRIHGMVDRPFEMSFDDLLTLPTVEEHVTIACVSNRVGGDLVGTAKWLGVPLPEILDRAGVQDGATQIVGRSVDGFTVGFPTSTALDGRTALVAVGMNDEPLPFDHGFPARLIVAGLYGYVSATKWLSDIELTTWDGFDAYWVPRGWDKAGPVLTSARIDKPFQGEQVFTEPTIVAGVAWAPTRGISGVEVRFDEGPWQKAELTEPINGNTWVQWKYEWIPAEARKYLIQVRAIDGDGAPQTGDVRVAKPNAATGYHGRIVHVT